MEDTAPSCLSTDISFPHAHIDTRILVNAEAGFHMRLAFWSMPLPTALMRLSVECVGACATSGYMCLCHGGAAETQGNGSEAVAGGSVQLGVLSLCTLYR